MPDGDVVELLACAASALGDLYDQKAMMTSPTTAPRTNMLALIGFIAAFVMPVAGVILGVFAVLLRFERPAHRALIRELHAV